jgi:hypothetical protein
MRKREAVPFFEPRLLFGIKTLINDDFAALQPDRSEYVRLTTASRNPQPAVQVIEFHPKLEVLFDDVLDGDRRPYLTPLA